MSVYRFKEGEEVGYPYRGNVHYGTIQMFLQRRNRAVISSDKGPISVPVDYLIKVSEPTVATTS